MSKPNLGKLLGLQARKQKFPSFVQLDPTKPARTRFAPSPTGFMHLGSLRTCLYNYLLARSTKGQFILRIEDTDRRRLIEGAEQNILDTLKWAGIQWDEGPFYQSKRQAIYSAKAEELLASKKAYRCFCSHERLNQLTESAKKLGVSSASYDRKCMHLSQEESDARAATEDYVIRFKLDEYPEFYDALHGPVVQKVRTSAADVRYDDFVIVKSDKMPTYHFANVVDDYLMKITHVIRGEEWIAATPKHMALYNAFGYPPPTFVHIPLLASKEGRKLSKRSNDAGVLSLSDKPYFYEPEAVVNFVALQGWSPHRGMQLGESSSDVMTLSEMETQFSLKGLTKGLIKLDFKKLDYLNKCHFQKLLETDFERAVNDCHKAYPALNLEKTRFALQTLKSHVTSVEDYLKYMITLYETRPVSMRRLKIPNFIVIKQKALDYMKENKKAEPSTLVDVLNSEYRVEALKFLRFALIAGKSGMTMHECVTLLGFHVVRQRIEQAGTF